MILDLILLTFTVAKNNQYSIKATLGEHDVQTDWESNSEEQVIQVEQIIPRSDYNENTIDNDVAILKLAQDVQFNDYVVPACLPSSSANDYTGQSAVVSGIKRLENNADNISILQINNTIIEENSTNNFMLRMGYYI